MKIGRILAPVHTLGPGERIGVWVQGCSKGCCGCISPELQTFDAPSIKETKVAEILLDMVAQRNYHRLTISGGDPFEQPEELKLLLQRIRKQFDDILVYTGYTYKEILNGCCGQAGFDILQNIDVLIDGRYIENRNNRQCILRGSDNQKIIFLNEHSRKDYCVYLQEPRKMETFCHNGMMILVGIMNREDTDGERDNA